MNKKDCIDMMKRMGYSEIEFRDYCARNNSRDVKIELGSMAKVLYFAFGRKDD